VLSVFKALLLSMTQASKNELVDQAAAYFSWSQAAAVAALGSPIWPLKPGHLRVDNTTAAGTAHLAYARCPSFVFMIRDGLVLALECYCLSRLLLVSLECYCLSRLLLVSLECYCLSRLLLRCQVIMRVNQ
jgi:hypothetical protein